MTTKKASSYGHWDSPISSHTVAFGNKSLIAPRVITKTGRAYFIENRDGRSIIVEIRTNEVVDVLPAPYSARNAVYEYGGTRYDVCPDDRIIFSNKDNSVCLLDPDLETVVKLIDEPQLRYSSFNANATSPWVLAIEEDHTDPTPSKVQDRLVAINTNTRESKVVVSGADFYYGPVFNDSGTKLAWLEWNHPDLPFDSAKLYTADWDVNGVVSNVKYIAGKNNESVAEPRWGPNGSMFFCKEETDFRQLFRIIPGSDDAVSIRIPGLENAEFAEMSLLEGTRTYVPLSARHLVASVARNGLCELVCIDLESGSWIGLTDADTFCHLTYDAIARLDDFRVLVIGSSPTTAETVYELDIRKPRVVHTIRSPTKDLYPAELYSRPQNICITSKGEPARDIHGFLWMPRNPNFEAPHGDLPPLIIMVHGGPTGCAGSGLKLRTQYFTTRGYAYFLVNHGGSTGHGRSYRQSLNGQWGRLDADDVAECARHFIEAGLIRPNGVGVTGVSSGGYNTLQSLVRNSSIFAAGVCIAGISDLERLDESAHKLESQYATALMLPLGANGEDKKRIYREHSALFHAEKIKAPLLLLHGDADTVVPVEQARSMADILEKNGADVRLVAIPEEGHMIGKPDSVALCLEEEEKWWRRNLL